MTKPECNAVQPRLHVQQDQLTLSVPMEEEAIIASAQQILKRRFERLSPPFTKPQAIKDFLQVQFLPNEREVFACLFLDHQHRLIKLETLAYGSVNRIQVHQREVVKAALKHNCSALIAIHNHPCGDAQPSDEEVLLSQSLQHALDVIDIRLLDHFIVGVDHIASLTQMGKLQPFD